MKKHASVNEAAIQTLKIVYPYLIVQRLVATYSATRWWSHWEVIEQVSVQFGDVLPFLQRDDLESTATTAKLLTIFTDPKRKHILKLSLLLSLTGKPFIISTYSLVLWY